VNQNSTFNILRVLSSFKELSDQFGTRADQIYNWIIYLTKQYHPQTLGQWVNAVYELGMINRKTGQQGTERTLMAHPVVLNRTTNEMNYSHIYEDDSEHHKSLAYLNLSKESMANKKQLLRRDLRYMTNESKIHYISF
jgi:hypothetical protein